MARFNKSIIIALITFIILVVLFLMQKDNYTDNDKFPKLFPELNTKIDLLNKIEFDSNNSSFYLVKKDNNWKLPSYNFYPASNNKVKKLLINISSLKVIDRKTNNSGNHYKLGLDVPIQEGAYRIRLFYNKELISDFIITVFNFFQFIFYSSNTFLKTIQF